MMPSKVPQTLPLVTAVIPAYNAERFLDETIRSVLNQTYPRIECVVVNDGSSDATAEIAKSFGDRIVYLEKENGGVSSARNLGIENARGDFIAFLDADDLWLPHKIARQVEALTGDPSIGLVYGAVIVVDEELNVLVESTADFARAEIERVLLLETPVYLTMTGMVPKRIFREIGHFDERLSTSADADMACRIALRFAVHAIDSPLAIYRQHGNQMHNDLKALEHDSLVLFEKVFSSPDTPAEILALRSRAFVSLEQTLAIAMFARRQYGESATRLIRSLRINPLFGLRRVIRLLMNRKKRH